ncbi:MAG: sodium:solute symporter family transporter, partial [Anaerotignaceae bacterium]
MQQNMIFTLITFVAFTVFVGIVASKLVTSDDQSTSKGYFLAGNGLSGIFIAGSMMLTNLSAENLVGLSGQSYGANMSGMAWEATASISTIVMALVFLPIYLKKGYTTLPEFMEDRYGKSIRRIVSLLFLIGYLIIGIPV